MAKNFMYKVPTYFRVCFVIIIVREESQIMLKFRRKSLSKRENSAAIFLVFLRVNPIAQRAYYRFLHCCYRFLHCCYRFLHCCYRFLHCVTDFCTVLQIFALFWVMFGINCTRINQSQPRNICLYIIMCLNVLYALSCRFGAGTKC